MIHGPRVFFQEIFEIFWIFANEDPWFTVGQFWTTWIFIDTINFLWKFYRNFSCSYKSSCHIFFEILIGFHKIVPFETSTEIKFNEKWLYLFCIWELKCCSRLETPFGWYLVTSKFIEKIDKTTIFMKNTILKWAFKFYYLN
jgi:hypothetical protein